MWLGSVPVNLNDAQGNNHVCVRGRTTVRSKLSFLQKIHVTEGGDIMFIHYWVVNMY